MDPNGSPSDGTRRRSLVSRLVIAVDLVLVVVLGTFLLWEYRAFRRVLVEQKRSALDEEAKVLLASIGSLRGQGAAAVQEHIDDVCGVMQETTSPGHHIAVQMGSDVFQARAHRRASPAAVAAMRQAVGGPGGLAPLGDQMIVVGSARQGPLEVFVSEYLVNVERATRRQVGRRLAAIGLAGLGLGVALDIAVRSLLGGPLQSMVHVVRRFADGDLHQRMPAIDTLELGLLADEFDQMADALLAVDLARRRSMAKARRIQENLKPDLAGLPGVRVACLFEPASEVAGDYYDVQRCRDGSLIFCVADASGHGIPAAMAAGMLKALLQLTVAQSSRPAGILRTVNRAFCRVGLAEDFATMVLVRWVPGSSAVEYASAGHEPCFALRGPAVASVLESTGPVLGVSEQAEWTATPITVEAGDRLVLLTDGLAETVSPDGTPLGRERLRHLLTAGPVSAVDEFCERIRAGVSAHRGSAPQADDLTVLAARFD